MSINLTKQGEWVAAGANMTITQNNEELPGIHGFIEEQMNHQSKFYDDNKIEAMQFYQI